MSSLAGATSGLTLAMGDVRRLMAKVMTRLDAADVEHRAKTGEVPDSVVMVVAVGASGTLGPSRTLPAATGRTASAARGSMGGDDSPDSWY